jgi:hypothetical protein
MKGVLRYQPTTNNSDIGGPSVPNRLIFLCAMLAAMLGFMSMACAQTAPQQSSTPDISGVWLVAKVQPALFPKGGAPLQPWAEAKFEGVNLKTDDPELACLPEGVPRFMFIPLPMEILQMPSRIVIVHEGTQVLRQIYMNRQHRDDLYPTYSGDSIGRWQGDTLVVDSIGFNDKTWIDMAGGLLHSEAMHVIERIRRTDQDTLVDDMTIEDTKAFTKPITAQQVYKLKPGWEIQEYVCAENNKYGNQGK